jgi:hypothetical protein
MRKKRKLGLLVPGCNTPCLNPLMSTTAACVLLLLLNIGCPPATVNSIVGRWQVSSVVYSPREFVGLVDSFQIDLRSDLSIGIVPGSGFNPGVDLNEIEIVSEPQGSYTVSGGKVRVTIQYALRHLGTHFAYTQLFELREVFKGELTGKRTTSVYSQGKFLGSVLWDESWVRVHKSAESSVPKLFPDFSRPGFDYLDCGSIACVAVE